MQRLLGNGPRWSAEPAAGRGRALLLLPAVTGLAVALLAAGSCSSSQVSPPPLPDGGLATMVDSGAGTAGAAGDAGGDGAGGQGPWQGGWLDDPGLWKPIASQTECAVHQALLPSTQVPRRIWVACGNGCLMAPVPLEGQKHAMQKAVVATTIGGEIYYRVSSSAGEGSTDPGLDEVSRLSDDAPVTLLKHARDCLAIGGYDTPFLFLIMKIVPYGREPVVMPLESVGLGSSDLGAPVVWQLPGVELPSFGTSEFDFDGGWGWIANLAVVRVDDTPGSAALDTVFSSLSYQLNPVARGPLVAWSDFSDWSSQHRARIRSWTAVGGTVELTAGAGDAVYVALSDSKMVWLEASGPLSFQGDFESAQLFWSPPATSPAAVQVHAGPMVPNLWKMTGRLATHGDLAATIVVHPEAPDVLVANVVTGETWTIPSRPCCKFLQVMAMNDSTLLLQEVDKQESSHDINRLVRLDLGQLDELGKGQWP